MTSLSQRLFRLAQPNAAEYLVSLNFKKLVRDNPRDPSADARAFYEELREEAKSGPLFSFVTIQKVERLSMQLSKNEVQWIGTCLEKSRNGMPRDLPSILDYIRAENPDLSKLTFQKAEDDSLAWHLDGANFANDPEYKGFADSSKYATHDVVKKWPDGYTMVRLSPADCKVEGALMQHCVGKDATGYAKRVQSENIELFSLRDPQNKPHVTIEVDARGAVGRGTVEQVQGKQNKPPVEKYHPYIDEWLTERGNHTKHTLQYASPENLARVTEWALTEANDYPRRRWEMESLLNEIAGNSKATPEMLVQILRTNDDQLQRTSVANPNADATVMQAMVNQFLLDPEDVSDYALSTAVSSVAIEDKALRELAEELDRMLKQGDYYHGTAVELLERIEENPKASGETRKLALRAIDRDHNKGYGDSEEEM